MRLVKNIESCEKPTGIAHIIGNKGGVMVSFKIHEQSFCFINSHLAAKPNNAHLRKANYLELIKKLKTGDPKFEAIF